MVAEANSADHLYPGRSIYQDALNEKAFSGRSTGGFFSSKQAVLTEAPWSNRHLFEVLDDIDREFSPADIHLDPVVKFTKEAVDIADLPVKEAQSMIATAFSYHSDLPVLIGDVLRNKILPTYLI